MRFEFDAAKNAANKDKHGIDFVEAQALWNDPRMLIAPARTDDEQRFFVIGRIGVKYWSAICTARGDGLRLISVRRARREEIERYEGA